MSAFNDHMIAFDSMEPVVFNKVMSYWYDDTLPDHMLKTIGRYVQLQSDINDGDSLYNDGVVKIKTIEANDFSLFIRFYSSAHISDSALEQLAGEFKRIYENIHVCADLDSDESKKAFEELKKNVDRDFPPHAPQCITITDKSTHLSERLIDHVKHTVPGIVTSLLPGATIDHATPLGGNEILVMDAAEHGYIHFAVCDYFIVMRFRMFPAAHEINQSNSSLVSQIVDAISTDWLTVRATKDPNFKEKATEQAAATSAAKPKKKGCYVATAVYGSYNCPQVWVLRRYRDARLNANWFGRAFIKCYYAVSPTLVRLFGNTKWFNALFKNRLDRLVMKLKDNGYSDQSYFD